MYRKEKNIKDILYILENLREEDKHEAITQKGENYIHAIASDIVNYKGPFILGCSKKDDTPIVMGGCCPTCDEGVGVVWMLSTPEVEKNQICLLRNIKELMNDFDKDYWMTFNLIYKENHLAKKWLSKMGYSFNMAKPVLANIPKDFEFFYRTRKLRGLKTSEPSNALLGERSFEQRCVKHVGGCDEQATSANTVPERKTNATSTDI